MFFILWLLKITFFENSKFLFITSYSGTIFIIVEQEAAGAEPDIDSGEGFFLNEDALDPSSNFDYTHMTDDGTKYSRGGYPYIKPFGWFRLGLNVQDRYAENNSLQLNIFNAIFWVLTLKKQTQIERKPENYPKTPELLLFK